MPSTRITGQENWVIDPLPPGWVWHIPPRARTVAETAETYIVPGSDAPPTYSEVSALYEWAAARNSSLSVADTRTYSRQSSEGQVGAVRVPRLLRFYNPTQVVQYDGRTSYGAHADTCPVCGVQDWHSSVICPEGHTKRCPYCENPIASGERLYGDPTIGGWGCERCLTPCAYEGCSDRSMRYQSWCASHSVRAVCGVCGEGGVYELGSDLGDMRTLLTPQNTEFFLCGFCIDRYCEVCRRVNERDENGEYPSSCRNCLEQELAGNNAEEWDDSGDIAATRLAITRIPGREMIRRCGVEIEGAGRAGGLIAADLYRGGLNDSPDVMGYHHGGSSFAHVERDSSVDWELVVGPINMAETGQVRKLNKAVRIVRKHIKEGAASLDLRCGLHIHVDAAQVRIEHAYNLHHIYTFLEDVLYRLGSARWPIHRSILNGTHYCQLSPKSESKLSFINTFNGNRYMGLSFNNYLSRMLSDCGCGTVRYGLPWNECTCSLRKCTFEFRLFNSTANSRKLHAYLALTQALVAKAMTGGEIENPAEVLPAQPWIGKRLKDMDEDVAEEAMSGWVDRLRYIVNELPLTQQELESVRYCVEYSELANLGESVINEVFAAAETRTQEVVA